jgi:hypothetical protein
MKKQLTITLLFLASFLYAQNTNGNIAAGTSAARTVNGELVLRSFQKCFPDKTGAVAFIDNDWTITAGGETFFWVGGRLLPRAEKDKIDSYSPHFFYVIPARPLSPDSYPPQYVENLRSRGSREARLERRDINRKFMGILYGGLERKEIEALLVRVDFLGYKVNVHKDIADPLRRVDAEIRKWNGARDFISSIGSIDGFSWRQIAGTQRMSYHSWGLAVDIQPKRLGGKAIYWLWEMERNKDWMLVPLENRWNPPLQVIEAFEKEGFIWGGKWPVYDNMHFEYRPELHEFSRLMDVEPVAENNSSGAALHHVYPDTITGNR